MIDDNQQQEQCPLCRLTFSRRNYGSHLIFCQDRYERQMKAESLKSHEELNSTLDTLDRLDKDKSRHLGKKYDLSMKRKDKAVKVKKKNIGKKTKKFDDSFFVDESSEDEEIIKIANNNKNNQAQNRRILGKENEPCVNNNKNNNNNYNNNNNNIDNMNNNMNNYIDISKTSVDNDDFMKQRNTCVSNIRQETHRNDPYFQINSNSNAYADDSNFGKNNIEKSYLSYMHHQLNNNSINISNNDTTDNDNNNNQSNNKNYNICKSSNNSSHQLKNLNHTTAVTNSYIDTSQKKELDYSEKEREEKEKNEKKMRYDAFQEIVLMTKNILKTTSFPKNKSETYKTSRNYSENIGVNKNKIFERRNNLLQYFSPINLLMD